MCQEYFKDQEYRICIVEDAGGDVSLSLRSRSSGCTLHYDVIKHVDLSGVLEGSGVQNILREVGFL